MVPNTCEIPWSWENIDPETDERISPAQDNYNDSFFKDIGLIQQVESRGFTMEETVILLQHTRVVPRKKIELAIDLAFELEKKFHQKTTRKNVLPVIVSGHSGDEQNQYLNNLYVHYTETLPSTSRQQCSADFWRT